jgi:hypothetical protein
MDNTRGERQHDPNYDKFTSAIDRQLQCLKDLLDIQIGSLGVSLRKRGGYYFDVVLTTRILENEVLAETLDTDTALYKPDERKWLLLHAAILLVNDNTELPGIDELVDGYLDRYNHIEEQLSRINGSAPAEELDYEQLQLELAKLCERETQVEVEDDQPSPFVRWLGSHATWRQRP